MLGPLEQFSVHLNGPFGEAGTVLWLCPDHKRVVSAWNTRQLTVDEAREAAAQAPVVHQKSRSSACVLL